MHLMRGLLKHPVNELPETMIARFVWCIVRSTSALTCAFGLSGRCSAQTVDHRGSVPRPAALEWWRSWRVRKRRELWR